VLQGKLRRVSGEMFIEPDVDKELRSSFRSEINLAPINGRSIPFVSSRYKHFAPTARIIIRLVTVTIAIVSCILISNSLGAQTRRRPRPTRTQTQTQGPRGSAAKYSAFLHSSDKHKSLACNACHKVPTAWNAKRDFPDVADFPDHDACVRCHRQQFFTRQVMMGTGPSICTVCHVRAAPREDGRFAFGSPNVAQLPMKQKQEWQFTIEFPHDKHQNAIARVEWHRLQSVKSLESSQTKVCATNPDRASQLGTARARVFLNLFSARHNRALRQRFGYFSGSAYAFRQARWTLAATGKLLQRPLDDAIFKRVKADYCQTPCWF
jgi:hypothetical protein